MLDKIAILKEQLSHKANEDARRILACLDLLYRADYAGLPLHNVDVPLTNDSIFAIQEDLNFQLRWSLLFIQQLENMSTSERTSIGELSPPYTPESVANYMEQIKSITANRGVWYQLQRIPPLSDALQQQRQSCQQLKDINQTITCGTDKYQHQMRYIPSGILSMGAEDSDDLAFAAEKPQHHRAITAPFWMDITPVTQQLYTAVMTDNPSRYDIPNCPVSNVRWIDAIIFCNRLSQIENLTPCYQLTNEHRLLQAQDHQSVPLNTLLQSQPNQKANGYRLPTEAEWEYAAKAQQQDLYSGSDTLNEVAWYHDNSAQQTHPVCEKKPNAFGLYDMSGNVWEWCWDSWDGMPYPHNPDILTTSEFRQDGGVKRCTRGGSWYDSAASNRVTHRIATDILQIDPGQGFRLVRTICR